MAEQSTTTYQLSELTNFIRRVFALNLPQPVWIAAELAQANPSRGHTWLTLVQKDPDGAAIIAKLEAVVWKTKVNELQRKHGLKLLRGIFQEGMSVRLRVVTSFHAHYGLRLVVEEIDPDHTIGDLERRRQETLRRLSEEGLLAKNSQLRLSQTPQRLAVISSETAAGLADFRRQLTANPYGYAFQLRLFPAAMQGVQAGDEIASRLRQIIKGREPFDAVVIIRGGGGRTDLVAFDDEQLARSIADYPLPVITGIGHEIDEAIVDQVAHTKLKTPTAAAVFLIDRLLRAEGYVRSIGRKIHGATRGILDREGPAVDRLRTSIQQSGARAVRYERERLQQRERQLADLPRRALAQASGDLLARERLLTALRPETTLARGYALVSQSGKLITDADEVGDEELIIRFDKGRVHAAPRTNER